MNDVVHDIGFAFCAVHLDLTLWNGLEFWCSKQFEWIMGSGRDDTKDIETFGKPVEMPGVATSWSPRRDLQARYGRIQGRDALSSGDTKVAKISTATVQGCGRTWKTRSPGVVSGCGRMISVFGSRRCARSVLETG